MNICDYGYKIDPSQIQDGFLDIIKPIQWKLFFHANKLNHEAKTKHFLSFFSPFFLYFFQYCASVSKRLMPQGIKLFVFS